MYFILEYSNIRFAPEPHLNHQECVWMVGAFMKSDIHLWTVSFCYSRTIFRKLTNGPDFFGFNRSRITVVVDEWTHHPYLLPLKLWRETEITLTAPVFVSVPIIKWYKKIQSIGKCFLKPWSIWNKLRKLLRCVCLRSINTGSNTKFGNTF